MSRDPKPKSVYYVEVERPDGARSQGRPGHGGSVYRNKLDAMQRVLRLRSNPRLNVRLYEAPLEWTQVEF
jgi:hypothetical protein